MYHNPDTQAQNKALVLSRAGKSTGKNRIWFNIKNVEDNSHQSVNFSNVKGWKNVQKEILVTIHSDTNFDILRAK